jgi:hypothetical protein
VKLPSFSGKDPLSTRSAGSAARRTRATIVRKVSRLATCTVKDTLEVTSNSEMAKGTVEIFVGMGVSSSGHTRIQARSGSSTRAGTLAR